jgi:hypothetical protein
MRTQLCSLGIIAALLLGAPLPGSAAGAGLEDLLADVSPGMVPTTMGGAFVAVADDASTVHWNPAGLARGGGAAAFHMTLAGENLDDAEDAADQLDLIDPDDFDFDDALELIRKNKGTYGVTVTPQFILASHRWALSVTGFGIGRASLEETVPDQEVRVQGKAAVFASGAISHGWEANDDLRLGASARYIYGKGYMTEYTGNRTGVTETITDVEPTDRTVTFDVGALYRANENVTYGAAVRNITSPTFFEGTPAKTTLAATLDIGAAYRKDGLTLAADLHNLLGFSPRPDPSLHLGARYEFPKILSIQVGLYDGDPTIGAGLDLGPLYVAAGLGENVERMVTAGLQAQW